MAERPPASPESRAVGHRLALLGLVVAIVVAACSSAAAPTPQIIYVTPPPTAAPPTPTPTPVPTPPPEPTPIPEPTMTTDDLKIDGIVKDGTAAWMKLLGEISTSETDADLVGVFEAMKSLADTQILLTNVYMASPCTQDAWTLYKKGMGQLSSGAGAVVQYMNEGAVGTMPGEDFIASGTTLGEATKALQASTC